MHRAEQERDITIRDVRCACAVCGAHVIAWEGRERNGWCNVCGSYELVPLASDHDGGGHELVLGQQSVLHREEARGRAA
jgi:hypothetical protein